MKLNAEQKERLKETFTGSNNKDEVQALLQELIEYHYYVPEPEKYETFESKMNKY